MNGEVSHFSGAKEQQSSPPQKVNGCGGIVRRLLSSLPSWSSIDGIKEFAVKPDTGLRTKW